MQRGDNDFNQHKRTLYTLIDHYVAAAGTPDHYHYDFAGHDYDFFHGSRPVNIHEHASACYHDYDHCRSQQYGDDFGYPFYRDRPSEFDHDDYVYDIGDDPIDEFGGSDFFYGDE